MNFLRKITVKIMFFRNSTYNIISILVVLLDRWRGSHEFMEVTAAINSHPVPGSRLPQSSFRPPPSPRGTSEVGLRNHHGGTGPPGEENHNPQERDEGVIHPGIGGFMRNIDVTADVGSVADPWQGGSRRAAVGGEKRTSKASLGRQTRRNFSVLPNVGLGRVRFRDKCDASV
jgi:hypothetical protein